MFRRVCGFRVRVWESYRTSRMFRVRVWMCYRTQRSSGYCGTGVQNTEVPGGYKKCCTRTPGIVARGLQRSQKFRVRVWMPYRTHRSSSYWYERHTELPEVPGTGNTCGLIHALGRGARFEVEDFIQLAYMGYIRSLFV